MRLVRQKLMLLLASVLFLTACSSHQTEAPNAVDAQPTTQLFLIGDATLSNKRPEQSPEAGWGMVLADFAKPALSVSNHAGAGYSSKSFKDVGRWEEVVKQLRPGDYVLIQFGHNDQKITDPTRYTSAREGYKEYLRRYVRETLDQGAHPLLVTPVCRRRFNDHGQLQETHGEYPDAMRELARSLEIPLVDMQAVTWNSLQELGPQHSRSLYMHLDPGQHPNYPRGRADDTHFSRHGALWATHLFLLQLRGLDHPLARYFYGS